MGQEDRSRQSERELRQAQQEREEKDRLWKTQVQVLQEEVARLKAVRENKAGVLEKYLEQDLKDKLDSMDTQVTYLVEENRRLKALGEDKNRAEWKSKAEKAERELEGMQK